MAVPITREHLVQLRLASHFSARNDDGSPPGLVDVVRRLLAVQAQEFGQALWAVGLRAPGGTREDVLAVLDSAEVVRSYPIRGTLHFVRPADLRWMLSLTGGRMLKSAARRLAELDLDQRTLERAGEVAQGALAGGLELSRDDFLETLNRAGISTAGQRGYHIIWYLAHTEVVCWGPPDGSQQALVLLDEWAPVKDPAPDRDEALRRFVLGYFTGHGPATLQDFTWWSKLTVADAKQGLAHARGELTEYTYDGASYWAAPEPVSEPGTDRGLLLPGYDEYILGYQDRALTLPRDYAARVMLAKNGVFKPTLVLDGGAVGTWRRNPRDSTAAIASFPESEVRDVHVFDAAIGAYERFLAS